MDHGWRISRYNLHNELRPRNEFVVKLQTNSDLQGKRREVLWFFDLLQKCDMFHSILKKREAIDASRFEVSSETHIVQAASVFR